MAAQSSIKGLVGRLVGVVLAVAFVQVSTHETSLRADDRPPITLTSLLDEMTDPATLATYPDPAYQQRQASSYNRQSTRRDQTAQGVDGWFADGDGLGYIRMEERNGQQEWVIMEHEGPGCLTRLWTPFFYYDFNQRVGPKLRIYLDGATTPVIDENFIELLTRNDWPASYGATPTARNKIFVPSPFADFTARAGDLYLPIPFAKHCKVVLSDKPFYHLVNYRTYPPGAAVTTFTLAQFEAAKARLAKAGAALKSPAGLQGEERRLAGELAGGDTAELELPAGPAALAAFEVQLDSEQIKANPTLLRSVVLKIEFDGEETVWCPLGDFFCSANAINPFATTSRSVTADGRLTCRWTMPYQTRARISCENLSSLPVTGELVVYTRRWKWDDRSLHFFARWREDEVLPGNKFTDWNFVDIRGRGVFVGDAFSVLNLTRGWWGEGDEKIYIDDAYDGRKFPDHFGTGTEDYYGWAGGVNPTREDRFHHPLLANVCVGSTDEDNTRGFNQCTRVRLLDAIPFEHRLVFDMEASPGVDQRNAWNLLGYSSVVFFYARPGATTNRPPRPEAAAKPIMSLEQLDHQSQQLRADIEGSAGQVVPTSRQSPLASTPSASLPDNIRLTVGALPPIDRPLTLRPPRDYLLDPTFATAAAYRNEAGNELILDNQLLRRTWRLSPNGACVGFDNLVSGQAMLRSVRPEARIIVDGVSYDVGGLQGQPNHAFISPEWLDALTADPKALRLVGVEIGQPTERLAWARVRHCDPQAKWPPAGVAVRFDYDIEPSRPTIAGGAPSATTNDPRALRVSVHYEMYDGLPAMAKWISVANHGSRSVKIDRFVAEELAAVEQASWVETGNGVPRPDYLHVETDFAFGGFTPEAANRHVVRWLSDAAYETQVNYSKLAPCLLEVSPAVGPAQDVAPGQVFESCRVFELAYDAADRERRSLSLRRLYRTIAPWVTENPLTHHLLDSNPTAVKRAVDEAASTGFECLILSFGSGFDMEREDPEYRRQWKEVADYAAAHGIEIGGYSLFSSRRIGGGNDIVSPPGQQPTHGSCPAATSPWGLHYYQNLRVMLDSTGFMMFENDGPYPGDVDVTPRLPYQQGPLDSQWAQWRVVTDFYRWCRSKGIYINAPDYYYLQGTNKCGMGYRETNWSLPRPQQVIHSRQNIFDGTWEKTPSMGWMFVPLAQYHGGGEAATVEPLVEHLDHYERMMAANFGLGVQAHFRGPRLFDTPQTRDAVTRWVRWYKDHREILESDVIHGRRADGRDLDWMLHVNPLGQDKGLLVVYNPLPVRVQRTLPVQLYFTGLTDVAHVSHEGTAETRYALARDAVLPLTVDVPASQMTWYVIR